MFFLAADEGQEVEYLTEIGFERLYEEIGEIDISDPGTLPEVEEEVDPDSLTQYRQVDRPMWDGDVLRTGRSHYIVQNDEFTEIDIVEGTDSVPSDWGSYTQ